MKKNTIVIATPMEMDLCQTIEKWGNLYNFHDTHVDFVHIVPTTYYTNELQVMELPEEKTFVEMRPHIIEQMKKIGAKFLSGEALARSDYYVYRHHNLEDAMVDHLKKNQADLLVVATRGKKGIAGLFSSSFAEKMLKFSPCDVLVLRPKN